MAIGQSVQNGIFGEIFTGIRRLQEEILQDIHTKLSEIRNYLALIGRGEVMFVLA